MTQRPDTQVVQQLPISVYSGWDKVQDVLALLAQHDYGMFRNSSIFVDSLWRDDRVKGVLGARIGSLVATPLEHKPADRSRKAQKVRDLAAGSEDEPGIFELVFPASVIKGLANWMIMEGFCLAELVWVEHPRIKIGKFKMWIPRLRVWHPQFCYWDWSTFSYVVTTRDGLIHLPKVDEKIYSDGKWFVYCPDGYQYGWLRAAVRSLAIPGVARGWANRDWSRHSEVQGIAIRKAFAPAQADEDDKTEFFQAVANAGAELTVLCERPDDAGEGTGFDVKYEEAKARTWECFKDLLHGRNTDIAIDLLGQELSTEASPTGLGSGVAALQNQVRVDIRHGDAKLAIALRNQVMSWWAFYNFDDPELAPRTAFQVDPPEDELAEASAYKMLGDAVTALKGASEAVDGDAILDGAGVPLKSEEEIEAERQIKQQEAQEAFDRQQKLAAAQGPKQLPPGKREEAQQEPAQLGALAPHPRPGPVKRYDFQGLPIAVENPAGTMRHWYASGEATPRGSTKMLYDYGFIEGHAGSDGEDLDVYVGPDPNATMVHIVHQAGGPAFDKHDEDKIFLGFPSADAAREAYVAHRDDGDRAIGGMSVVPLARFKAKLLRRRGRGKITATALRADPPDHGAALRALEQLAARATDAPPAPKGRTLAGKRRAARYVDRLQGRARELAARALKPDLAELKKQIEASSSFEDLRARVTATYKDKMDPKRLAELVRKVNLMAHLYGRTEAVDSL